MSLKTISKYGLTKTEAKILDTILKMESGNAYGVWKKSKLKHYPTVLRTLKKLEKRGHVDILSVGGSRGERVYTPTLMGKLVSLMTNGEEKEVVGIVSKNSSLFRELHKIDKDDYWALETAKNIIWDVFRKREPRSFDDALMDSMEEAVVNSVTDGILNREEGATDWILKLREVDWVREIAVDWIEHEKKRQRKIISDLDNLKGELTRNLSQKDVEVES